MDLSHARRHPRELRVELLEKLLQRKAFKQFTADKKLTPAQLLV